jgi:protein-S-isoprenylcysteine O-methyltransferase Ste14
MKKLVAWLGGVVFVGSLALLAWWYFGLLGRRSSGSGVRALVVDAALILVFAGHHSVFARDSVKRRLAFIPADMLTSFYVWVASLLLFAVPLFWMPIGGDFYRVHGWLSYIFVAVQLAGLWISSRAVAGLDALELAGIRQVIGSRGQPRSRALQVTGPYRFVRHPLYLGWVLMFFGAPAMTVDRLTFAGLTTLYLALAVPWEEKGLRQSYGGDYAQYAERVRWRIVPLLY